MCKHVIRMYSLILIGHGLGFNVSSIASASEMASMEPQMSSLFNDIGLPPSLRAFTTAFQPGMPASLKTMSGVDNSLQPASFGISNSLGFDLPFMNGIKIEEGHGNTVKSTNIQLDKIGQPPSNLNDLQIQTSLMREAGSGSSTPSAISASSMRNSIYRTTSVDSQLALLRNEMVFSILHLDH